MAMSTRILSPFFFLVACQEAPQLALDPVADASVDAGPKPLDPVADASTDAGPESLELTELWVTEAPPLPAIRYESEDRIYPFKTGHYIPAVGMTADLLAKFSNASPSQTIESRVELRYDEFLISCVREKTLVYRDGLWGRGLIRFECTSLDPEMESLTREQVFEFEQGNHLGVMNLLFTSEGFASTSRTYKIRLCPQEMKPQDRLGNECDLREPE